MKSSACVLFSFASLSIACSTEQPALDAATLDGAPDDGAPVDARDAFVVHDASTPLDAGQSDTSVPADALPDAIELDAFVPDDAFVSPDAFTSPDAYTCLPTRTCASQASDCGMIDDGCGTMIPCGDCTGTSTCGGDGIANVCSVPTCTRRTCGPGECGFLDDGCGAMVACGGCAQPQTCGGSGPPNVCGIPSTCTGLCLRQVTCADPARTTSLTGHVYAPNGVDPLPNVIVYVPNAPLAPFSAGVTCDQCSAPLSGSPLVRTTTAFDGSFTLRNVPTGTNVPLVMQIGRWRRPITIPNVPSCADTLVPAALTRLPRNRTEGDIPLMAISTGALDTPECVLRKIGIADAEFTASSGPGRVHLYRGLTDAGGADGGATIAGGALENQLWATQATLNRYDAVIFGCQGNFAPRALATRQLLVNYANAGGRVLADHYAYTWLFDTVPFSATAAWHTDQGGPSLDPQDAAINTSFARGATMAQWLVSIGATTNPGYVTMSSLRRDLDSVIAPSSSWMTITDILVPSASLAYSFDTPVGAPTATQCGRVTFDDYHPQGDVGAPTTGMVFPTECVLGPMTPEEHVFEYMLFDLERCVEPDAPPTPACVPATCTPGVTCGGMDDGCGHYLDCGACNAGGICGGAGVEHQCFMPCVPASCASAGAACGTIADGCGGTRRCGGCAVGASCESGTCVGG